MQNIFNILTRVNEGEENREMLNGFIIKAESVIVYENFENSNKVRLTDGPTTVEVFANSSTNAKDYEKLAEAVLEPGNPIEFNFLSFEHGTDLSEEELNNIRVDIETLTYKIFNNKDLMSVKISGTESGHENLGKLTVLCGYQSPFQNETEFGVCLGESGGMMAVPIDSLEGKVADFTNSVSISDGPMAEGECVDFLVDNSKRLIKEMLAKEKTGEDSGRGQ